MKFLQITTTVSTREAAASLGKRIVNARLAACAQAEGPVESTYRWQGNVETATEWRLCLKTRDDLFDPIVEMIQEAHEYEVPEIVAVELVGISKSYADWLVSQLRVDEAHPPTGDIQ